MFQLTGVPVLWDVVVTFLSSIVALTPTDNFWIVPLLHSVSNMVCLFYTLRTMRESFVVEIDKSHNLQNLKIIGFNTNRMHVRNTKSSYRYLIFWRNYLV